jgi:hypothetical protein
LKEVSSSLPSTLVLRTDWLLLGQDLIGCIGFDVPSIHLRDTWVIGCMISGLSRLFSRHRCPLQDRDSAPLQYPRPETGAVRTSNRAESSPQNQWLQVALAARSNDLSFINPCTPLALPRKILVTDFSVALGSPSHCCRLCTPSQSPHIMPSLPDTAHSPFRLTEKHFKNRSNPHQYPSLHNQSILDLSRPLLQEDDEVWQAGWWAIPDAGSAKRTKKGKERARGERPEMDLGGLRGLRTATGRIGWVVAEGQSTLHTRRKVLMLYRLYTPTWIP